MAGEASALPTLWLVSKAWLVFAAVVACVDPRLSGASHFPTVSPYILCGILCLSAHHAMAGLPRTRCAPILVERHPTAISSPFLFFLAYAVAACVLMVCVGLAGGSWFSEFEAAKTVASPINFFSVEHHPGGYAWVGAGSHSQLFLWNAFTSFVRRIIGADHAHVACALLALAGAGTIPVVHVFPVGVPV